MRKVIFSLGIALSVFSVHAQTGVGINEDGSQPDPSAILDVKSSHQGMLIPRMNIRSREAILHPATGLLVYQTDSLDGFYYFDGQNWVRLGQGSGKALGDPWLQGGNILTNSTTEYLGTQNNQDLSIRTNNQERMRILAAGQVGIGTNLPQAMLHIKHGWSTTMVSSGSGWPGPIQVTPVTTGNPIGLRIESQQSGIITGSGTYNPNKWDFSSNSKSLTINNPITNNNALTILNNGNTGIGTTAPKAKLQVNGKVLIGNRNVANNSPYANYMLAVDGTVIAQRYVASLQDWPDYVFECADELPTWEDQRTYWRTHQHLMNVPPRQEIVTNGVSLGDMQVILLEKLEQLYLYVDQLHNELDTLRQQNQYLQQQRSTTK